MVKTNNTEYIELILNGYYKRIKKPVREKTIKAYTGNIRLLYNVFMKEPDYAKLNQFHDVNGVIKTIKYHNKNINTQMAKVSALIIWLRANNLHKETIDKYTAELFKMNDTKSEHQSLKIKTKLKMNKNKMKWLRNMLYDYYRAAINVPKTERDRKSVQRWLLFNLYNGEHIPPVRSDYNIMKIVDKYSTDLSSEYNYYSKEDKQFIFCNYKTNKRGITRVDIPDELVEILQEVIPLISNQGYLIVDKTGEPMNANRFGKIVQTTFEGATICDLRKYYLTHKFKKLKEVLDELKDTSRQMMNSPSVCLSHYISEYMEGMDD